MNINGIGEVIGKFNTEIILGLIVAVVVLIVINIVAQVRISSIREKYNAVVGGNEDLNLEEMLIKVNEDLKNIVGTVDLMSGEIKDIYNKLSYSIQKTGMVRYNALEDLGSNQSYSIALLDQHNTGFIITNLYGRDFNANYLKPVKEGKAEYKLSMEEEEALKLAISN